MTVYYNEFDPYCAQWLRNLIDAGHIAPGHVDERSIEHVRPNDLRGYKQCHFFAGLGVWSYALRQAGWSDDTDVWTASCPCQPFSAAGKGEGFADERHLWPALFHLIGERRPAKLLGEQVASADTDHWVDLVQADLEAVAYAFGCVAFPAAGVGAPNIRDRNYWVANADGLRQSRFSGGGQERIAEHSGTGGMVDAHMSKQISGRASGREQSICERNGPACESDAPGPINGFWRDADWLACTDGFWRPVESGTFPLADGIANRMGKLRAFGNAINAQQAIEFIRAAS